MDAIVKTMHIGQQYNGTAEVTFRCPIEGSSDFAETLMILPLKVAQGYSIGARVNILIEVKS
jgi:hypothetical protein